MKKMLVLGIAVALACAAYAYPTLSGPTGLLTVPTAAVAPAGQFQFAADMQGADDVFPIRALYGFGGNFEIGANFITGNGLEDDVWGINAKYALPYTFGDAAWGVGALYQDSDSASTIGAYLSLTKEFEKNFSGTASLMYSDVDFDDEEFATQVEDDSNWAFALGAQATLDNGLTLIGEYVNSLPGGSLNAAARYPLTDALTAQVGFVNDLSNVTIGFNYVFGGSAE